MSQLKQATLQQHLEVEASMPVMQPHLHLGTYRRLLVQLYTVIDPLEGQLLALPIPNPFEVAARQKAVLLRRDLDTLGVLPDTAPLSPRLANVSEALGAMYVLEGATLGGQVIARHLQTRLALTAGSGSAYFTGYGSETGQMWRRFGAAMTCTVLPEDAPAVIAGAQATFTAFQTALTAGPA